MNLWSLAREYESTRVLVLESSSILQCMHEAVRYYCAYGDVRSLSKSDPLLPGVVATSDMAGEVAQAAVVSDAFPDAPSGLPIKSIDHITDDTVLTPGEWAIVKPLFILYVEREQATHLEASRGLAVDVFGRSVAEIQADITLMETETLPSRCFVSTIIEI